MKTININFVDWPSMGAEEENLKNKIMRILQKKYKVVVSDNPDYIFCNVFGYKHLDYMDCIKIFICQENTRVDFNFADYAIGLDDITFGDRYLKFPFPFLEYDFCDISAIKNRANLINMKNKFCSFMVSEPTIYSQRYEFFEELCNYKKVDSGGRYANNIGGPIGDRYNNFTKSKIEWLKNYKFNICFENSYYPGYFTEKIFHAYAAGCVPIYWGDPSIDNIINPKSYINISNFENFNQAIEHIKLIDSDDDLFVKMLSEPVFKEDIDYVDYYNKQFEYFLFDIFNQDLNKAKRVFKNHRTDEKINTIKKSFANPTFKEYWLGSNLRMYFRNPKKIFKSK